MAEREGAVREVAQVYELIKTHHPLLLVDVADEHKHKQLSNKLLTEALRALNVALSVMMAAPACPASVSIKAEPMPLPPSSSSSPADSGAAGCKQVSRAPRRVAKRRRSDEERTSWVNTTTVPHDDGYQWRKYGEKAIHGTPFTRSYFRCTYKTDKGCLASKQIQQKDSSDPPTFQVTYTNEHTCTAPAADGSGGADIVVVKQEPYGALPAVPCQEIFQAAGSINNSRCGVISASYAGVPSMDASTGSCSAVVSCDEVELGQTTVIGYEAAAVAALEDDSFFSDPYLFLLYDSFKYC